VEAEVGAHPCPVRADAVPDRRLDSASWIDILESGTNRCCAAFGDELHEFVLVPEAVVQSAQRRAGMLGDASCRRSREAF
jgi:hypothetical protein